LEVGVILSFYPELSRKGITSDDNDPMRLGQLAAFDIDINRAAT
jgi:hypothetical protein